MKILNKALYILATMLEVILLASTYVVNYFTSAKMGMARFVSAKNYKWETIYDMIKIKYICIVVLVILALLVLLLYLKRKTYLKESVFRMNIVMVIFVLIFTGFNTLYSTYDFRAFYFISAMLGVATLIQIIKTLFAVYFWKNNN